MGGTFNTILGIVDSWLGRAFLLASYFPWLLFAVSNLALAAVEFPAARSYLAGVVTDASADKLIQLGLAMIGVGVLAYTLSPATRVVRRLLEGQGLWPVIAEPLGLLRVQERLRLTERRDQLFQNRARLPKTAQIVTRLAEARRVGARLGVAPNNLAVDALEARMAELRIAQYLNRPIDSTQLDLAVRALAAALESHCVEVTDLTSPTKANCKEAQRLDELRLEMVTRIAPYAIEVAQNQEEHAIDARQNLYANAEMAPTRLGNDMAALRSYCETRYGFDFDFFWPRLQLVMKSDRSASALSAAHIQVDFSILCLTLSVLFVAIWLVVLAAIGHSLSALLIVAVGGPAAIAIWLWMAHESYAAYAEVVRSAIDVSRLDLLETLRQPSPKTMDEEKATWEGIGRRLILNDHDEDVSLDRPAA